MVEFSKMRAAVLASLILMPVLLCAVEYSLEECQAKALEGNAEAQWQLGQRYENGDGVKKNDMRAIAQYKKAAEQKHRQACAKLADLYDKGMLVKKDPVMAAKYRAWAGGGNGELAAVQARTSVAQSQEDEIETALDYILGRNGKPKDPKTGIRILYQSAKDKPIAQKVFVDRWSQGDLDGALSVLSNDEWEKIIPWYKNAWDSGNKRAGLVLGNDAYSRKQYTAALMYWQGSGLAKCWYFVGRFYNPWNEEDDGGGPANMRDETKARRAYEQCLRIDRSWDDAEFDLGCVYLFAKKTENVNLDEAQRIFRHFLQKNADDKVYNFYYGLAGYWLAEAQFDKKWPKRRVETLLNWGKKQYERNNPHNRNKQEYDLMMDEWQAMQRSQKESLAYIRKSANLGFKPAQEFVADCDKTNR